MKKPSGNSIPPEILKLAQERFKDFTLQEPEFAIAALENGEILMEQWGDKHGVDLEVFDQQLEDSWLIHNHPNESSFSTVDFVACCDLELRGMIVVNPEGNHLFWMRPYTGRFGKFLQGRVAEIFNSKIESLDSELSLYEKLDTSWKAVAQRGWIEYGEIQWTNS